MYLNGLCFNNSFHCIAEYSSLETVIPLSVPQACFFSSQVVSWTGALLFAGRWPVTSLAGDSGVHVTGRFFFLVFAICLAHLGQADQFLFIAEPDQSHALRVAAQH